MKLRLLLLFCVILASPCYSQTKEHSVALTWNASTSKSVTSYNIYRRGQSSRSWVKIGSTAETRFTDHDVKARETYLYMVTAVAGREEGAGTRPVKAKIPRR